MSDSTIHVCYSPRYYTFVGKRRKRVDFTYSPYYGLELLNDKGRRRPGTKSEIAAIVDWLHRNTYRIAGPGGDRERIGYVKPRWKP